MKSRDFLLSALLSICVSLFSICVSSLTEVQENKCYCVVPTTANSHGSCYALEYYMQNARRYFTTDTEINLMPGKHHLFSPLLVDNVANLSIIGDFNTTIWCYNSYISIANSALVEIKNIKFMNCGIIGSDCITNKASLILNNVASFRVVNTTFQNSFWYAITGINIYGNSSFENVKIFKDATSMYGIIQLTYQEATDNYFQEAYILIKECKFYNIQLQESYVDDYSLAAFKFLFSQQNYPAKIQIENTVLENITSINGPLVEISFSTINTDDSQVTFLNSIFTNNNNKNHSTIEINILSNKQANSEYLSLQNSTGKVPQWSFFLLNCQLHNNTSALKSIFDVYSPTVEYEVDVQVSIALHINFTHFTKNTAKEIFGKVDYSVSSSHFVISQCEFVSNKGFDLEFNSITNLTFNGPNLFYKNYATSTVISFNKTIPLFIGENKFSRNIADVIMHVCKYILLLANAEIIISNNIALSTISPYKHIINVTTDSALHPCIFQFMRHSTSDEGYKMDNSISFVRNIWYTSIVFGTSLNSCYWVNDCVYANTTSTPGDIFGYVIHYKYDTNLVSRTEPNICYCQDNETNDCIEDHFNPMQAGRIVTLNLKLMHSAFSTAVYINSTQTLKNSLVPPCDIPLPQRMFEVSQECTTIFYSVISNLTGMCSLYLTTPALQRPVYVYYVTLQKCPLGFVFLDGKCDCDPVLTRSIPNIKCNPENASILHSPDSWLGMTEDQTEFLYYPSCISYYCSPDVFYMQLNNPDVQCLHNRTGLICGHCPVGLDAMLGSLQCSKCSNHWLLLILVFFVIGIILVLTLFVLNLTVVDGKIYGFIFYANVLNTFMYKVFPVNSVPFVVVSLANLDWGIETCFYHGMTEYAKVWLRFAFPIYLFFIIIVIMYASRYSQRIERLTRRRVIPVIATIFLLSYNKILLVTNTALFYYVKVQKLRSNEIFRVWGLDTSVPLFGTRFLMLFIPCLLIFFLILVPTNILLLFTKLCYRSQIVSNNLKPFMDAYHAPIKESHHHFLGVEFLIRTTVFILGNNLLDVDVMLAVSVLITLVFTSYFCWIRPFKKTANNIIYLMFMCSIALIPILNVAFQFKKTASYIVLFNLFFAAPFMLFLGISYYHAHKYVLLDSKAYRKCFTSVSSFTAWSIKQIFCNPAKYLHSRRPTGIEECPLQEELLFYEK